MTLLATSHKNQKLDNQQGLLCAFAFHEDRTAESIGMEEVTLWLEQQHDRQQNGFIWLHFNLSHQSSLKWLKEHCQLPEQFYDSLSDEGSSTRIELAEGHLIALVNDLRYSGFDIEPSEISTLWASANAHMLVTVRKKALRSIDQLRVSVEAHEVFNSPSDLLAELFRHQADVMAHIMRQVTNQVDTIEDGILTGRFNHKRNQLGSMRRTLVRLQRLLAPEPAALFRLINKPPVWMRESDVNELRQATEEFSTVMRDMLGLQERIKLLQEEIAALIIEQTNRSLFILTGLTVIALPVNMIAGLFGMNVGGIPYGEDATGFWVVVTFALTLSVTIAWLGFRKSDRYIS
jgi:zinc transporter